MFVEIRNKIKDIDLYNLELVAVANEALMHSSLDTPFSFNAFCTILDKLHNHFSMPLDILVDIFIDALETKHINLDSDYKTILDYIYYCIEWKYPELVEH